MLSHNYLLKFSQIWVENLRGSLSVKKNNREMILTLLGYNNNTTTIVDSNVYVLLLYYCYTFGVFLSFLKKKKNIEELMGTVTSASKITVR
jgi:hypothetical protein